MRHQQPEFIEATPTDLSATLTVHHVMEFAVSIAAHIRGCESLSAGLL